MRTNRTSGARRITMVIVALSLLLPLLAACSSGKAPVSDETRVLRIAVMYGDSSNEDYLKTQYTDLYEFTHDNIDIEFVHAIDYSARRYSNDPYNPENEPDPVEEMKKLIEGPNPPDIVMVSYDELGRLIEDNLLTPLDSYIQKDQFDTSDFVPTVIDGLKKLGNNQLYALAPTFSSSALVYNKQMFTERGVEFPTDGMSWDEVFALAERVSHGEGAERKYGFSFSPYSYGDNLMYEMSLYTDPLQLSLFDEEYNRLMVDSDGWERVWQTMLDLRTKKIVPDALDYSQIQRPSPFEGNNFLMGRVAMIPMHYGGLNDLVEANRNADVIEGYEPIDWDVVTLPIHPEVGNVGGSIYMDPIMGITANAQNSEDAWDFIKFINGPEWAELKARSSYNMVARKSYIKPHAGENYNVAAFFELTPAPSTTMNSDIWRKVPNYWEIQDIGYRKFQEVLDGDKEVRQALQEWAVEGQEALQRMRESMNGETIDVLPF